MRNHKASNQDGNRYVQPHTPPLSERIEDAREILTEILRHPFDSLSIVSVMWTYLAFYVVAAFMSGEITTMPGPIIPVLPVGMAIVFFPFFGWTPLGFWFVDIVSIEYLDNIRPVGRGSIIASVVETLAACILVFKSPPDTFDPKTAMLLIAASQCLAGISCFFVSNKKPQRILKLALICASITVLVIAIGLKLALICASIIVLAVALEPLLPVLPV